METLTNERINELFSLLEKRYNKLKDTLETIDFAEVKKRLLNNPDKLKSLNEMDSTGGEPAVVWRENDEYVIIDLAKESPQGRRSCCYDDEALEARKKFKPDYSALGLAEKMGIEILTEEEYRRLQEIVEFDLKTSTWVKTPDRIRKLGGAIFCDRRYDTVFTYHNGADSYYGSRAFRGKLKV